MRLTFMRFLAFLSLTFSTWVFANQVSYHIDIDDPAHHLATVRMTLTDLPKQSSFEVKMPQWRTGKYKILDLANGVRQFSATTREGKPLSWRKIDGNTWQVDGAVDDMVVSYQVYANQLGTRTRHIDDTHAYLDASAVFMYVPQLRNKALEVTLKVPAGWRSVSGMDKKADHHFVADNYDILVDSPIETGLHISREFSVEGRDYELIVWGRGNYDVDQMVTDLSLLVEQGDAIWQGYPYERYVFMVHATSGARGATEHLNSTIIQRDRHTFASRKDYLQFLSTASHEFVHTWNVKAYRPQGLVPYDYDKANYSTLIWLSEGSTSYFQMQLLLRAGLAKPSEYFEELAKRIVRHKHKPGKSQQSVSEASFDTWIDESGDRGNNASVNIYSEGFLVSWILDAYIQQQSGGKYSYRDVHNRLYQDFRLPATFNDQDVKNIVADLVGHNVDAWWQANVLGHLDIDFDTLLGMYGLELVSASETRQPWLGLRLKMNKDLASVTSVERDGPAWVAGLTAGDKLVAINGMHVKSDKLTDVLQTFNPGESLTLTIIRRDELHSMKVTLGAYGGDKYKVSPIASPSEQQKVMFKHWLGVDFPAAK